MRRPLVSVVIPTMLACWKPGREKKYFMAALRSALSQSFKDYEVIVVHPPRVRWVGHGTGQGLGLSSNPISEGCTSRNPRVRFVPSRGSTVGAARNAGIRAGKGTWVAFLDSDDLWFPHKLSSEMRYVEKNPDCDIVHSDAIAFVRKKNVFEAERLSSQARPLQGHLTEEKLHHYGFFILTSSLVMKKRVWEKSGPFNENLQSCEDDDFLLRAFRCVSRVGYISEPLLLFRLKRRGVDREFLRQKADIYLTQ